MNNIDKLEKVTQMYRAYVHMMHGHHAESQGLQGGETLQGGTSKGGGNNARSDYDKTEDR